MATGTTMTTPTSTTELYSRLEECPCGGNLSISLPAGFEHEGQLMVNLWREIHDGHVNSQA